MNIPRSFQSSQPTQPRLRIPLTRPKSTIPTFQPKQPTSVPIFQPKQPTSVPIFQPKQPTSVPTFQPKQPTSVPTFQPKQPTSVPTFQPKQIISVPTFQPSQTKLMIPLSQPKSTIPTFQSITSPQNQQFQISAKPQDIVSSTQKLTGTLLPTSDFQLQKIQISTASPQNQQFQSITSPENRQFQISTGPQAIVSPQQKLTGTLLPSSPRILQFQTPTTGPQTTQFQIPTTGPQTITGVLLPPQSDGVPQVSKTLRREAPLLAPLSSVPGPILSSTSPRAGSDQIWKTFRRDDLFLLENDGQTPYRGRSDQIKTSVHWGQRKLALTTLAMINLFWNPEQIPKLTIVYAGSAPGTNLKFVMEMYPQIEWHLYDPHPVGFNKEIKAKHQVHVFSIPFTNQVAKGWENRDDVFFISDVRTDDITETGIWNNMKMQEEWVEIINPVVAMLKFRLPYSGSKFSNEIDYTKGYAPYLAGIVMKQPWAGQTSTETRLLILRSSMINGKYPIHNWNIKVYEDKMFHLNSVIRESVHFYNPFYLNDSTKRTTEINPPELLNDWDSLVETTILNDLLTKTSSVINRLEGIKGLGNLLTISLRPRFMAGKEALSLNYLRRNPGHFKKHFHPHKN